MAVLSNKNLHLQELHSVVIRESQKKKRRFLISSKEITKHLAAEDIVKPRQLQRQIYHNIVLKY